MSIPISPKTSPFGYAPIADISLYQDSPGTTSDDIDWAEFGRAGFACAIIKATEGASIKDPSFARSLDRANEAGVDCGVYAFNRPRPADGDAEKEADYLVDAVGDRLSKVRFFILDIEEDPPKINKLELAWWIVKNARRIRERTGRTVGLYTSPDFARRNIEPIAELLELFLWAANWGVSSPSQIAPWPKDEWTIWQDGLAKSSAGIKYDFDHNWFHGDVATFKAWLESIDPRDPCAPKNLESNWAARALCVPDGEPPAGEA